MNFEEGACGTEQVKRNEFLGLIDKLEINKSQHSHIYPRILQYEMF